MTSYQLSKLVTLIPWPTGLERAVLRVVCDHYPNVWPSIATIAQEAGCKTTAARKYLRTLEHSDLIRPIGNRKGGRARSEQYVVNVPLILGLIPETQRAALPLDDADAMQMQCKCINPTPREQNPTPGEQNPTSGVAEQRIIKEENKELKPSAFSDENAGALWEKAKAVLKDITDPHVYSTWIQPIKAVGFEGDVLVLTAPTQVHVNVVRKDHASNLLTATQCRVALQVRKG